MKKNTWKYYNEKEINELNEVSDAYKIFISSSKTEREAAKNIIKLAESQGFRNLDYYIGNNYKLTSGDKVYVNNRDKSVALFIIGDEDITNGINILGAHIDSPRLDLKSIPLYEDSEFAYFDTHYYGGIKKYQWVTLPLALHGVVVKKTGEKVFINIGEDDNDPVVGITDLLPHLGREQLKKEADEVIMGDNLDILIGSRPLKLDDKDKEELVKENILNILKEKYAIIEDDFLSAEIEVVPAGKARDFGLDKSMVMAYGQDDKVCAFTSLKAFLDISKCRKTISCILVDKEEIGSVGATGMESSFYEDALREICSLLGNDSITSLGRVFKNSKMLSSDVTAAYDPLYADVSNKRCETFFNRGVSFCKYTGARGKSGSNDASCEYIAELRKIMDENDVKFQITEMGKVDAGGGGTIAYILANKNVSVIDCGVGVLSMHAPWEVTSKSDIYEAYKCYKAFLKDA